MTLIEVATSSGVVGRCDAKCYLAEGPDCDCICGGRNHGAGQQRAIENTRELAEQWIADYAERMGLREYTAGINGQVYQLSLFDQVIEVNHGQ